MVGPDDGSGWVRGADRAVRGGSHGGEAGEAGAGSPRRAPGSVPATPEDSGHQCVARGRVGDHRDDRGDSAAIGLGRAVTNPSSLPRARISSRLAFRSATILRKAHLLNSSNPSAFTLPIIRSILSNTTNDPSPASGSTAIVPAVATAFPLVHIHTATATAAHVSGNNSVAASSFTVASADSSPFEIPVAT